MQRFSTKTDKSYATPTAEEMFPNDYQVAYKEIKLEKKEDQAINIGLQKRVRAA